MSNDTTRERILQAAGEAFAAAGYRTTTVRDICQRADVNLASVNYHFGDKQRLYIEAVKHARRLREQQAPMPEWSADTPPSEKLAMFVLTLMRRMLGEQGDPWQTRLVVREIMEPTKACEEMVQEAFRPVFEMLIGILAEMMPPETPRHELHKLALSLIGQCFYYRSNEKILNMLIPTEELQEHFALEQLAHHITAVMLAAMGQRPPLGIHSVGSQSKTGNTLATHRSH